MGWKEALQITLFVLSWVPVGFLVGSTLVNYNQPYNYDFSIFNTGWNGTSKFRQISETLGHETLSIETSMSVITRYNGSGVLVILGPVRDFTFDAALTIFDFLQAGGSVLIADDFGTANSSFYWLNQLLTSTASLPEGIDGFLSFTGGVLLDLDSYDRSPKLPIIRDFVATRDGGALTLGVHELHLNWATTLSPRCALGAAGIAYTTVRSWCETNITDPNPYPDEEEWAGRLPVAGAMQINNTPDAARNVGRLVAVSDPSIFTNDMIDRGDNEQFAENIITWLSAGYSESPEDIPVIFCESLLEVPLNSVEFFYGIFLSRALWMTTQPVLAPLYPIITAIGIKKYLPDMKKPEVKSVSDVFLRKGQTYFSERLKYYRTEGNYARVVKMLYRKLRRDLMRKNMWSEFDLKKVWEMMKYKDTNLKENDFFETFRKIDEISKKPDLKIKENELMELFFFMRNISSKLVETK